MKNIQTQQTLQQMKKVIAYLRVELEVLAEKVDRSLERQKRIQKKIKKGLTSSGNHG